MELFFRHVAFLPTPLLRYSVKQEYILNLGVQGWETIQKSISICTFNFTYNLVALMQLAPVIWVMS